MGGELNEADRVGAQKLASDGERGCMSGCGPAGSGVQMQPATGHSALQTERPCSGF